MRKILTTLTVSLGLAAGLMPAVAQDEDDGGFLTRTIEDALSGAGREVNIVGFEGALSSQASFDRMTIADDDGIWLTLEDVQLDWSRLALLRGRLEVERLSAAVLDLPRLPEAEETVEIPDAEATPFALPDLPVSVNVALFEVTRIVLGEDILGSAAELGVQANARLDDDGAFVDLTANRVDAAEGSYVVKGSFARETAEISVELQLDEEAGGLVGRTINLPGQPAIDLTVLGAGPLDDFTADITLATDGADRVAGQVVLSALPVETEGAAPDRRIRADLGGDITALVAPESRDFFGTDVRIVADALLAASGAVDVQDFSLDAEAVDLTGAVRLNSDGWPVFIDVDGQIARADQAPVVLPGGGTETAVRSVTLDVSYDAAQGDVLRADLDLQELRREDVEVARAQIVLDGTLRGELGTVGRFLGDLQLTTQGVALTDQTLGAAVGSDLRASAQIDYTEAEPIRITGLALTGDDYGLAGDLIIDGLADGFPTRLDLEVTAEDLSRFAGLAGQELAGAAALTVAGDITPLSSMFDLQIDGTTDDLAIGIEQADTVLAGQTTLSLGAQRSEAGTFVRDLTLNNAAVDLSGDAALRTADSQVSLRAGLRDIALVLPEYQGPVTVVVDGTEDALGWTVDLEADAPYGSQLSVAGRATGPQTDVRFDLAVPQVQSFVEQVQGPLNATGRVWLTGDGYSVDVDAAGPYESLLSVAGVATGPGTDVTFTLFMPEVQALSPSVQGPLNAEGRVWLSDAGYNVDVDAGGPFGSAVSVAGLATGPEAAVQFSAALPDLGVFVPQIRGPFSIEGDADREGTGWRIDTVAQGPAGTDATIAGLVEENGTLDLDVAGSLPLGLSEPFLSPRSLTGQARFDLAVQGPPSLEAVSGRITTNGARFAAPNLRLSLTDLDATVDINAGRLRIDAETETDSGGRITAAGTLALSSLAADLRVALNQVGVADPRLYSTVLDGNITVNGPLTGGARIAGTIDVGETLVTVPSSGLTSIGEIPDIRHVGAPAAVTTTRRRADVIPEPQSGGGGTARPYPLALQINAPRAIFVRGRGIDAELGGALRITGTTNRVISAGQFDLVRGRLDILGRRFDLDDGSIQFQGDLVPYIRFVTSSPTESGSAGVILEGPANAPDVSFVATPDAPEDQVLSQLLFGRDISEISALQALQLANAVAVLAGRQGNDLIGNLRQGFGLDDLDVTTTEDGQAAVRAGKYISENVYTDVTASSGGTELSINLDVTESLTARGSLEQDGNTALGIFFERDY
ncbi:translocation/assembly module TamB domain-containing protein [uncultured Roseobacter sp.]|uniref:translocation/assembly module TamB domain-containing protein n=1 Tax=uncultured Roseobacter sp. TaxID=114847 RepID=UPI0026307F6B|nr:translocation/assembly module TamB domain-containing protein [uncultured Roseobacter sp.]